MRNAFVNSLLTEAEKDNRIFLLVGDIGFGVFEEFKASFPHRYLNVGIAEQGAIGLVSGLSKEGFVPIFYTIIPFLLYRPFEFIRNDLCINERKSLLVGVGSGLSYGALGPTHHALEDVGVARTIQGLNVLSPSSPFQVAGAVNHALHNLPGCTYLRLGKNGEHNLEKDGGSEKWRCLNTNQSSGKCAVLTTGSISKIVEEILCKNFKKHEVRFGTLEQIEPVPELEIKEFLNGVERLLVIDEQYCDQGIMPIFLDLINRQKFKIDINLVAVRKRYVTEVGSHQELLTIEGLDGNNILINLERLIRDARS